MKNGTQKERQSTHLYGSSLSLLALLPALLGAAGCDLRDFVPIPSVEVAQPSTGSLVTSPVYFELDAKHWDIEPPTTRRDGAGYFVLVLEGGCVTAGRLVPFEQAYLHLEQGEFTTWVDLVPGEYEVCLLVADGNHRATALTDEVRFEVVE